MSALRGFRIGGGPRDPGRVIHRLKVRINAEHNRALKVWEHELRLHVKPRPRLVPAWFWKILTNIVLVQSLEVNKSPDYVGKES